VEKRYALCLDVLRRFQDVGILQEVILIGSWCLLFYREYFEGMKYTSAIRTRDIDFLVPLPVLLAAHQSKPNPAEPDLATLVLF
jgi:hypothetical protein